MRERQPTRLQAASWGQRAQRRCAKSKRRKGKQKLSLRPSFLVCFVGAGNGTRTRDPLLGKQMLYQLSYSRRVRANRPGDNIHRRPSDRPALYSWLWRRLGAVTGGHPLRAANPSIQAGEPRGVIQTADGTARGGLPQRAPCAASCPGHRPAPDSQTGQQPARPAHPGCLRAT